jgi:hypothetical protein
MSGKGRGKGKGPPGKPQVAFPLIQTTYCSPSFTTLTDLPIFQLTNSIQSSSGPVLAEVLMLNSCVRNLQEQIIQTSSLDPTGTIGIGKLPLKQQNIFCFNKETKNENEVKKYDGTVRAQGLFEITGSGVDGVNKLRGSDQEQKFAIQKNEGNPNGVLAMSLYQIINYLSETTKSTKKRGASEIKTDTEKINEILSIYEASRGLSEREKSFVNDLIGEFFEKFNSSPSNIYEKLEWISRVYCPLINKGLSDISQAGELAKVYVLKYINAMNNGALTTTTPTDLSSQTFWNVTEGLPYLTAFSSDGIASALGVRIQNLFRGQFQSIIPRKYGKGRFSVVYIPYKYVAMMILLGKSPGRPPTDQSENSIWGLFNQSKQNLITNISVARGRYLLTSSLPPIQFLTEDLLYNLRELVDNIYKYYKIFVSPGIDFFSKSIIKIIDEDILGKLSIITRNTDNIDELLKIANNFYTTKDSVILKLTSASAPGQTIPNDVIISTCFNFIKSVLEAFGIFIVELGQIVNSNEGVLTGMIRTKSRDNRDKFEIMPTWTGIIYSTLSYYDNCFYFKTLSKVDLLEKYLSLSKTEELCAEQDVDYGHDQTASNIQQLGDKCAEWFSKKISEDKLRPPISNGSHISETYFSKNLIDTLEYCSVAQTYDRNGQPILEINFTTKPDSDFMFNLQRSGGLPRKFTNDIKAIGNAEIWGSIDYTVGDPFINITKKGAGEHYIDNQEFWEYFESENIIEIRTPATNFDAAAPSGCVFKDIGRMSVSYRRFRPNNDSRSNEYMYVILTIDINKSEQENGIDFDPRQCRLSSSPPNIFLTSGEVVTILREECRIQRKNITLELMREFSEPFTTLTETQAKKFKGSVMLALIKRCYNREPSLKKMIETNFSNTQVLFEEVQGINTQMMQKGKQKTITDAQAREQSALRFDTLIQQIKEYYLRCRRIENETERKQCESLLRNFLVLLFDCMELGNLNSILQRYEINSEEEDKLLSAYEKGQLASFDTGIAAGIILSFQDDENFKRRAIEYKYDDDVTMTEDAAKGIQPNGLELLAIAASHPSIQQSYAAKERTIDDESGYNSDTQMSQSSQVSSSPWIREEYPPPRIIQIISNQFTVDNKEDAEDIYIQADRYFSIPTRQQKYKWYSLNDYQKLHLLGSFIKKHYNKERRTQGKQEIVPKEGSKLGGKIKFTKKIHKKYKNKVTKRRMNKRVRKTKRRNIKGKRITRRR